MSGSSVPVDRAADEPDGRLGLLVLRRHQHPRLVGAELAPPRLGDPVRVRVPQRRLPRRRLRQALEEAPGAVGQLPQDGVRERDRALEPRAAHELDGLVDGCVARHAVEVGQLVRAEPERGAHGRVELADRPPPERLDRVVERPGALDRAVGEAPRERAVALVEPAGLGAQRAIGVGAVLEDAPDDREGDAPRGRDRAHRRPRRQASTGIRFPPSGCTSSGSKLPSGATRARQTVTGRPSSSARAPMCGLSARTTRTSSAAGRVEVEPPVVGADLRRVRRLADLRLERRGRLREHVVEEPRRDLGRAREDGARVVLVADRERLAGRDGPCVELGDRLVDRDARLVVAGHDRPLDGRRTAPAREERRVDVEPQPLGEQVGRDEQAVRADDDGLAHRGRAPRPAGRAGARGCRAARPPPSPAAPPAAGPGRPARRAG